MTENTYPLPDPTPEHNGPYKDDTSDGTTAAKTPQEIAEETAGQVKASDDVARENEGREHPAEGHDVRDYRPVDTEAANVPENPGYEEAQAAGDVGDDSAVDEHGDPEEESAESESRGEG